jgi:hypothetical protein
VVLIGLRNLEQGAQLARAVERIGVALELGHTSQALAGRVVVDEEAPVVGKTRVEREPEQPHFRIGVDVDREQLFARRDGQRAAVVREREPQRATGLFEHHRAQVLTRDELHVGWLLEAFAHRDQPDCDRHRRTLRVGDRIDCIRTGRLVGIGIAQRLDQRAARLTTAAAQSGREYERDERSNGSQIGAHVAHDSLVARLTVQEDTRYCADAYAFTQAISRLNFPSVLSAIKNPT